MPPYDEINERNIANPKPEHVYRIPAEALPEEYRNRMDQLDYQENAEHPEILLIPKNDELTLLMHTAVDRFRKLHYFAEMKHLGIVDPSSELAGLLGKCHSFKEFQDLFTASPSSYCRQQLQETVMEHLAEIYDAFTRDAECISTADSNMQKMLENFPFGELNPEEQDALKNHPDLQPYLRNEEEQKAFAKRKETVRKNMIQESLKYASSQSGGSFRWANILVNKPGLSQQEAVEIRGLNNGKEKNELRLALRYLKELEDIDVSELKPYDWEEYHGENAEKHLYSGMLAFDSESFLSYLKPILNNDPAGAQIRSYIQALYSNYTYMANENDFFMNPFAQMIRFDDKECSKGNPALSAVMKSLPKKQVFAWNAAMGVGMIMASFGQKEDSYADFRSGAKRKEFVDALHHAADLVQKRLNVLEQEEKVQEMPEEIRRTIPDAPAVKRYRAPQINAEHRTKAYLLHAENLLDKDPAVHAAFRTFQDAMENLTGFTSELNTPDEKNRYLAVDETVLKKLKNRYTAAVIAGTQLQKQAASAGKKIPSSFKNTVSKVLQMLEEDRKVLDHYDAARKLTFRQMVNAAHSEYVDADALNGAVRSGQMSTRFAMNVKVTEPDEQTRYAKGLFTAAVHADPDQYLKDVMRSYKLKNAENVSRTVQEQALADMIGSLKKIEKGSDRRLEGYLRDLKPVIDTEGKITRYEWKEEYSFELNHWLEYSLNAYSPAALEFFEEFRKSLEAAVKKADTLKEAGIPAKSRVDQRSSAMSAVAELLGRETLICRSRPMMIRKNGHLIHGTFIEFSELSDPRIDLEVFAGLNDQAMNHKGFVKDAADLQVLDFICGNCDRHGNNMFYQIKDGKITGIQGIDNDLSFGLLNDDVLTGRSFVTNFKGLADLKIIPAKTAETIQGMTPEMLKTALAPYELSQKEIEAACHRLALLKDAIDTSFEKHPDEFRRKMTNALKVPPVPMFQTGKLYVVNDEQIEALAAHADTLLKKKDGNHTANCFNSGSSGIEEANRKYNYCRNNHIAYKKQPAVIPETALKMTERESFNPAQLSNELQNEVKHLRTVNHGAFRSSQEYRNLLSYAEIMQRKMAAAGNQDRGQTEALAATMLENLSYLTQIYLDKKDSTASVQKSSTASARFDAVRSLQDTLDSWKRRMNVSERLDYGRLSAIQRAGAFCCETDSRTIAACIKNMKKSEARFRVAESNLRIFFNTVSEKAYRQTFAAYTNLLARTAQNLQGSAAMKPLQEKAESIADHLQNLSCNDQGMYLLKQDLVELRTLITGDREKEGMLDQAMVWKMTPEHAGRILTLHEMLHLCNQAEHSSASPQNAIREQIAERIVRKQMLAHPQELRNSSAYETAYQNCLHGSTMNVLTAGKTLEQLKKYAEGSDEDLQKHWQKASAHPHPAVRQAQAAAA